MKAVLGNCENCGVVGAHKIWDFEKVRGSVLLQALGLFTGQLHGHLKKVGSTQALPEITEFNNSTVQICGRVLQI